MRHSVLIGHLAVLVALIISPGGGKHDSTPALPPAKPVIAIATEAPHARERESLRTYFQAHHCPLQDYIEDFISVSFKYHLDFRLLPAISVKESSCGVHNYFYNPFGFGSSSFSAGHYRFSSFPEAIDYVGSAIAGENDKERAFRSADKDTKKILYLYNGTVNPNYPASVENIMENIK